MKTKKYSVILTAILVAFMAFTTTSCSTESDITETQWDVINIRINKNDWKWVANQGQYEVIVDLPELTPFIFNEGAAMAYIKLDTNTKAPLPYSKSYSYEYVGDDGKTYEGYYTEHIKCDFQVGNPSTVAFYIEASDLARADEFLDNMDFQVVLIW